MKTIEEVIKELEYKRISYCCDPKKDDCPYHAKFSCDDAVHYLKEYQHMKKALDYKAEQYDQKIEKINQQWNEYEDRCQQEISRYQEAVKNCEAKELMYIHALANIEDNPPLTWDELGQLKRKPVWMEEPELFGKGWVIITGHSKDVIFGIFPGGISFWGIEDMGDKWQAYRKERGENEAE